MATWEKARQVKSRYEGNLRSQLGVTSVRLAQNAMFGWYIRVYVEGEDARKHIPHSAEGVAIDVRVTGEVKAQESEKGFTLVELVVVLAILGILLVLAVPRFMGVKRQAYKTQAYTMLGELKALSWGYYQEHSVFPESASTIGFQSPEAAFWTTPEVRWSTDMDDPSRDLRRIIRWETVGTKAPVEKQSCWLILRDSGLVDQGCSF